MHVGMNESLGLRPYPLYSQPASFVLPANYYVPELADRRSMKKKGEKVKIIDEWLSRICLAFRTDVNLWGNLFLSKRNDRRVTRIMTIPINAEE